MYKYCYSNLGHLCKGSISSRVQVSDCFVINPEIWFTLSLIFVCLQLMKRYLQVEKTYL